MDKPKLYEAMFLVDSALGGSELPEVIQEIVALLKRRGAEIKQIERWADRKLAYDIKGIKRGLYILIYMEAPPSSIAEIRADIRISERLVRVLILCAKEVSEPTGELLDESGEPTARPEPEEAEETEQTEPAVVSAEAAEGAEEKGEE